LHFLMIHFNIILPSTPGSSKVVSLPQVSLQKTLYAPPLHHTFCVVYYYYYYYYYYFAFRS
jgi:hypothetical protein